MSTISTLRLVQLSIKSLEVLLHSEADSKLVILGDKFDQVSPHTAYAIKRPILLAKARALGVEGQILGTIPWTAQQFDEQACLKAHCLSGIDSATAVMYREAKDGNLAKFRNKGTKAIVKLFNDINPFSPMQYPPRTFTADAEDPPAAERYNPNELWPNGLAANLVPPGFITNEANTWLTLDDAMFNHAVNKFGIHPELLSLRGPICSYADRCAFVHCSQYSGITAASDMIDVETMARQLGCYEKARENTARDKNCHSNDLKADEVRQANALSLFRTSLADPFSSTISSLLQDKSFAACMALLDATYMVVGDIDILLAELLSLMAKHSTFAHCKSITEFFNSFQTYISMLEHLRHLHDNTPAAVRPDLPTITRNWQKEEIDYARDNPGRPRKVPYSSTKTLIVNALTNGRFHNYAERFSVTDRNTPILDIFVMLLAAEKHKNNTSSSLPSTRVTAFNVSYSGENEEFERQFAQVVAGTSHQSFARPSDFSVSTSSTSGHTSGEFSELSDEMTHIYAAFAKDPQKYSPTTKCTICCSARDADLRSRSHLHTIATCPKLTLLSTMTDKEANKAGFPAAHQAGLPGSYASFLSNHKLISSSSPNPKPKASFVTADQFNSGMNRLADILVPPLPSSQAPSARKRTFINFIGANQITTSAADAIPDDNPPKA